MTMDMVRLMKRPSKSVQVPLPEDPAAAAVMVWVGARLTGTLLTASRHGIPPQTVDTIVSQVQASPKLLRKAERAFLRAAEEKFEMCVPTMLDVVSQATSQASRSKKLSVKETLELLRAMTQFLDRELAIVPNPPVLRRRRGA